ncbi:MFS transporter [Mycolicibacterium cosmeticum]|uniref:Arabinose efflux permease family protein n=1 Tax=Mycolicibacterium cosmeticum TaxID=258533 RepID=W9AKL6_MYCCO|nr:MFS transporter [Mycolicibacterium cosmeticum]CDO06259.1 arabinose efflux permease family protein [Mycolicibacterium cosmeticum]
MLAAVSSRGWGSTHPRVLIAVLSAAGISVSLMQTLIIPLVPELPKLLVTSPANASWAITATLLTAAVATPVFGRLGDIFGPKRMLIACAVLLTAGSLLCALTSALIPFIAGRGLQGLAIPIIPLGISVLRASVPAEKVGAAMGLMSSSLGVGGALGLPLSAAIAQHVNWHALFWVAAGLGVGALALFVFLVPAVPATSSDRLDPLGALLLAAGLVALLLGITKGRTWGWTSVTTLGMFTGSLVVLAVFAAWQLRFDAPIVDLRTTVRRPVLTTNIASIGVGFAMFALSLIAPQVLELPKVTGYGLGMSMLEAGLWMAPGGLAMMVTAPVAARVAAARGPRFTLCTGCTIIAGSYLGGLWLLGGGPQVLVLNVLVSIGVGFAYASMPALINAAVPISETAAANGINALARSLGTSISSAVIGAVLAGLTMSMGGQDVPTLEAFRVALLIAAGVAGLSAVLALLIPVATTEQVTDRSASSRLASGSARR